MMRRFWPKRLCRNAEPSMAELHRHIQEAQKREGTRVIRPPHALGFLDLGLPASR
jgi:hypothetical protein